MQCLSPAVTALSVYIEQSPGGNHFIGHPLTFSCIITAISTAVDTPVQVIATWQGPSGSLESNSDRNVTVAERFIKGFKSNLTFYSLQSSDSGSYGCISFISPLTSTKFIESSDRVSTYRSVSPGNATIKKINNLNPF